MKKRPVETIMGIVVLLVASLFLCFAYRVSDLQVVKGYELNAEFSQVGGLNTGADVMINGIKVGTVIDLRLDPEEYTAKVRLSIRPDVKLPQDSTAVIAGNGLMGNKFIKMRPGKSKEIFQDGDEITNIEDFRTLEDLVRDAIFMVTGNEQ